MQTERLILSNAEPVASGSRRLIYNHPAARNLLVKVHRPAAPPPFYKLHRRLYGPTIGFAREIREQLLVWSRSDRHPDFLNKIVGICETDIGVGMVVERLDDESGQLAKNLANIVLSGAFGSDEQAALKTFIDRLLQSPLYFDDLYAANIVYGFDRDSKRYRFVLVDGTGHKTLIPIGRVIAPLEKRRRRILIDRLYRDISRPGGNTG